MSECGCTFQPWGPEREPLTPRAKELAIRAIADEGSLFSEIYQAAWCNGPARRAALHDWLHEIEKLGFVRFEVRKGRRGPAGTYWMRSG